MPTSITSASYWTGSKERISVVASSEGGVEIEDIARENPDSLIRVTVEPAVGMQPFQAREIAFKLGIDKSLSSQAITALLGCYRAFRDLDATMVEINPLVVTKNNHLLALDAKMGFDDNALFRRPNISELRDKSQEDPRGNEGGRPRGSVTWAWKENIGCIINGAGLAMATMDMIKHAGGEPANFLDIGGGASPDRVAKAINLVLGDKNVRAILVNIFAGINRCDWVAEGIVQAVSKIDLKLPFVRQAVGHQRGRRQGNSEAQQITDHHGGHLA